MAKSKQNHQNKKHKTETENVEEELELIEEESNYRKIGPIVAFFNLISMPLLLIVGIYGFKLISDFDISKNSTCTFLKNLYPKEMNFESKLSLIALAFIIQSIVVLALTIFTMLGRIFTLSNPLSKKENDYITVMNRNIANSIEQSFIFFGVFAYYVIKTKESTSKNAVDLIIFFTISRLIFVFGYFIHSFTNSQVFLVRGIGYFMGLATQLMVIGLTFGQDSFGIINDLYDSLLKVILPQ